MRDLNGIVSGPSIYDEHRFAGVDVRQETKELIHRATEGDALAWLNRYLLEEAFPKELARKH